MNETVPLAQRVGLVQLETQGAGFQDVTSAVAGWLRQSGAREGLLTLFLRHTSASLTIQENADPDVRTDLQAALDRLAPQDGRYVHDTEGPDDMPAHIKTMLTGVNLSIPVQGGSMMLGTWQGIYLVEHRTRPHRREIALHLIGTLAGD